MAYQTVFKRSEIKYLLTKQQKARLVRAMEGHMALDEHGRTTICNLYFDTDSYRLIRRSLEKPDYKEKLRVRSYGTAKKDGTVFVELKKKYDGVVYKRRVALPNGEAMAWLCSDRLRAAHSQITDEIDYVRRYYGGLHPTVFLSYEREAYAPVDGTDFRVTFDENILCREDHLSLTESAWGTPLIPEGMVLMELKTPGGIPLWMTRFLTAERLYKTSFSKYGTAYRNVIRPHHSEGERKYA